MRKIFETASRADLPIFVALMLHAFSNTLTIPVLPYFLTNELGAGPNAASEFVFASGVSGLILTLAVSKITGRWVAARKLAVGALIWLAIGAILIGFANSHGMVLVAGFVFMCGFHVPSALLFGMLKRQRDRSQRLSGIGNLRITYILGSILGPIAGGGMLTFSIPIREVFILQALGYLLASGVVLIGVKTSAATADRKDGHSDSDDATRLNLRPSFATFALFAAIALLLMGDTLRVTTLPLLLDQKFSAAPWQIGFAMSLVPLAEVPFMLITLFVANRIGELRVLVLAACAGIAFFALLPNATEIWHVYGLQLLYSVLRTSVMAAGMSLLFELQPDRLDRAASLQFAAQQTAVLIGSLLASVLVSRMGLSLPYYLFVSGCMLSLVCLWTVALTRTKKSIVPNLGTAET